MSVSRSTLYLAIVGLAAFAPCAIGQAKRADAATKTASATTRPSGTTMPTAADLDPLIKQLDADDWGTRTRAAARIVQVGEPARPALEQLLAAGTASPEVIQQAKTVLAKLDAARKYDATPVTLHLHAVPAPQALAALESQAAVTFAPSAGALWPDEATQPRVTIDADREPFWSCFQRIAQQAGIHLVRTSSAQPIQVAKDDQPSKAAPFAVAGPFLLKVKRLEHSRAIEYEGGRDLNSTPGFRLSVFAWPEPKMAAQAWSIDKVDELLTDQGAQPVTPANCYTSGGTVSAAYANPGGITYRSPIEGRRVVRLRFSVTVPLVNKTEKFEVKNVLAARNVTALIGGYPFLLKDVNKVVDGQYAYNLVIRRGEHSINEFNSFRQALMRITPKLADDQGRQLPGRGASSSYGPNEYSTTVSCTCDVGGGAKAGPPATFSWEIPTDIRTLTFPVEFKDLPLP